MKQAYWIYAVKIMPSSPPHCVFLETTFSVVKISLDIGHPGLLSTISSSYEALKQSGRKPLSITISRKLGSPHNTLAIEAIAIHSIMKLLDGEWDRVRSLTVHTRLRSSMTPVLKLLEARCRRNLESLALTCEVVDSNNGGS
ncbi:hypothetical protein NMY22_g1398 [Coprinellus aureogranulatus]|nr:hypothetical protein NMY22_g1398 [Coprinellus aureogranulatus]